MIGDETDLVIVGGGPAGLAAAVCAGQRGLRAIVLEARKPPIDRACGEGVMPAGVGYLARLGVELQPADCAPFMGIRYIDGETSAEGRFRGPAGLGIRRTMLHAALVRRAEELAVDLRWGCRVTGISGGEVQTAEGPVRGRFVIGADGRLSKVRQWSGLEAPMRGVRRFGVRRHFTVEPWTDLVEVHWADGCEAYVTQVADRLVGIALLQSEQRAVFDKLIGRFPALARRIDGAEVSSKERVAGPFGQRCRAVTRGNVMLLGDASGGLDAISGAGLTLAFGQAFALVDAVETGDVARYAICHRALKRKPRALTEILLAAERRPRLRSRVVRALGADCEFFDRVLATAGDEQPLSRLGVASLLRFVRRLVVPA